MISMVKGHIKWKYFSVNYSVTSVLPVKLQTRIDFHDSEERFDFSTPEHSQKRAYRNLLKLRPGTQMLI